MKTLKLGLVAASLLMSTSVFAADTSVDEIINSYYENTGGKDAWTKIESLTMKGEFNQGGMKFPIELVQVKDGRTYLKFEVQGKVLKQNVFDGENLWNTNFMTMKAEKADKETTDNMKLNINDFPDNWLDYKKKGYKAELLGKEDFDGTETYKIKLVKEPVTLDGKKVDDVSYYYFDTESFVPLAVETEIKSGPAAGKMSQTKMSDYQEVDGLYFPFSISQGIKGGQSAPMVMKTIELNKEVSASEFEMPKEQ